MAAQMQDLLHHPSRGPPGIQTSFSPS